jgi:tetratricopeptide (TPR) repeat protein
VGAVKLGTVHFPNTGAVAAQEPFLRGIAWLHSFEYAEAIHAFREAQQADPTFALAYWGEALSYSRFTWGNEDLPAARAAIERLAPTRDARLAKAGNARERAFGEAVELLLGDGEPLQRGRAYADAMRAYAASAPDDLEAAAFAAHGALVGARFAPRAEALKRKQEAMAFAERVFALNPDHPGAAHYLIHATDSPSLATRGLSAARSYAAIAPDSPHALHMPSHIFLTLGLWDDVVASNNRAWDASRRRVARESGSVYELDFHSLQWLQYAYLQQGRYREARALVDTARSILDSASASDLADKVNAPFAASSLAYQYGAETGRWDALPPDVWEISLTAGRAASMARAQESSETMAKYYAGLAAILGAKDIARARLKQRAVQTDMERASSKAFVGRMAAHLQALIALANGDRSQAIATLTTAVESEAAESEELAAASPPFMVPPLEALGTVLLEGRRAREAAVAFDRALVRRPNRSVAWLGLARAKAALGDRVGTSEAYAKLLANWQHADPDLPALAEARAAVAGKQQ